MSGAQQSTCPGCRLKLPACDGAVYNGYFNASPECWAVFTEVIGAEFVNASLFGRVHQLTVDTYAAQHPGGDHPDKSIVVHLSGLHLMLVRGIGPASVPEYLQRLADAVNVWPHFPPPAESGSLTVRDVALAGSSAEHGDVVREWAGSVWSTWSRSHGQVRSFVERHLGPD